MGDLSTPHPHRGAGFKTLIADKGPHLSRHYRPTSLAPITPIGSAGPGGFLPAGRLGSRTPTRITPGGSTGQPGPKRDFPRQVAPGNSPQPGAVGRLPSRPGSPGGRSFSPSRTRWNFENFGPASCPYAYNSIFLTY